MIIPVDRSSEFNAHTFSIPHQFTIHEEDSRSIALLHINLDDLLLTASVSDNSYISGEEKLGYLKEMPLIRLDVKVFEAFWNHKEEIHRYLMSRFNDQNINIFFDGTILKGPHAQHYVFFITYTKVRLLYSYYWQGYAIDKNDYSATLKPS